MSEWTTIRIKKDTAQLLREFGNMGESYDDVLCRLIDTQVDDGYDAKAHSECYP